MKKILIVSFVIMILFVVVFQYNPAPEANITTASQVHQEDIQASLLSVNAGGALLPFILVLGSGAAGFIAYINRQRKKKM